MDVARIEAAARDVLAAEEGVVAAYLYGSVAEGRAHGGSDIDIAVLYDEAPDGLPELGLAAALQDALEGAQPVDVRVLNGAGLRFTHQVLKHGERIYTGDAEQAAAFEESFYRKYMDMKPLINEHDRIRAERMQA